MDIQARPPARTALIAEDSADYVLLYEQLLGRFDVRCYSVADDFSFRSLLLAHPAPDLILLDLQLSGSDGLALVQMIEESPLRAVALVVTGYPTIGTAFTTTIPVVDKTDFKGLREVLARILGPADSPTLSHAEAS